MIKSAVISVLASLLATSPSFAGETDYGILGALNKNAKQSDYKIDLPDAEATPITDLDIISILVKAEDVERAEQAVERVVKKETMILANQPLGIASYFQK